MKELHTKSFTLYLWNVPERKKKKQKGILQAKGTPQENCPHNAVCSNTLPLPTLQQAQPHAACSNRYWHLLESSSVISSSGTLWGHCSFPVPAEKLLKRISSMGSCTTRNVLSNLFQGLSEARHSFRGTALRGRRSSWRTIPEKFCQEWKKYPDKRTSPESDLHRAGAME